MTEHTPGAAPAEAETAPDVRVDRWLRIAVAAPVLAGIALTTVVVLAEAAGFRPFAMRELSVSEAAAEDEAAMMMRLIYSGASPTARYEVGTDIISGPGPRLLTPLEAAVMRNRTEILGLLERRVLIEPAERERLLCLAQKEHAAEAAKRLARDGVVPRCQTEAPARAVR